MRPGRVVAVADEECLCLAKAVPRSGAATVIVTVTQTQPTRARVRPPLSASHCAVDGMRRLTQRVQKQSLDGPQLSERSPQGGRK